MHLALAGLAVYLVLVLLARHAANPPSLVAGVGTNHLAALYTPFSLHVLRRAASDPIVPRAAAPGRSGPEP
ncbi:MAG: hypothetical protein QNK03_22675, partial [Myxococcota bacterium]|nr:hypothetical protein [Myxococcota bacterium]